MEHLQQEFMDMLQRCEGIVVKVCLMFSDRSRTGVGDLYQDIVYNIWKNYGIYRHDCSETTWVYRISLNVALQHARRRRAAPSFISIDDNLCNTLADKCNDPMIERLYELIDRLQPYEKKLVFNNEPINNIARIIQRPPSTVKKHLAKIKQKLKQFNDNEQ